ncbi:hypothetical protein BV25DRAFT_1883398 [Artomyces pyxidatus]|uniref:Uncharacterized protein n=1 Tax=Artomyces pyxidatus TaxID=48021 RepID=A0ACB8T496_9AGAM|nr:hypothetical protein BV25DRAFT_1883398 [Artomyces pyxidatus]
MSVPQYYSGSWPPKASPGIYYTYFPQSQGPSPAPTRPPTSDLRIQGPTPGALDRKQPDRILRNPRSTLTFASFNPHAAAGRSHATQRDHGQKPKRIVIETYIGGHSEWRFVPRANLAEGVHDEGDWPRLVNICGMVVHVDQDQWDIYKLDPAYVCSVPKAPGMPAITRNQPRKDPAPQAATASHAGATPLPRAKRRMSSPEAPPLKRPRHNASPDDDDDLEVEEMTIDPPVHRAPPSPPQTQVPNRKVNNQGTRSQSSNNAYSSRSSLSRDYSQNPETFDEAPFPTSQSSQQTQAGSSASFEGSTAASASETTSQPVPPHASFKRKGDPDEPRDTNPNAAPDTFKPSKRARMGSPEGPARETTANYMHRQRKKMEEFTRQARVLKERRDQQYIEELLDLLPEELQGFTTEEIRSQFWLFSQQSGPGQHARESSRQGIPNETSAEAQPEPTSQEHSHPIPEQQAEIDEEAAHQAAIAESRAKLAELERDRPLWEAMAQERKRREHDEAEAQRLRKERQRREEEERERMRQRRAAAEAERQRLLEEHAARMRREKQRRERWSLGQWTPQRALERYNQLAEEFDTKKFSTDDPLHFAVVPWPVLRAPASFGAEDIAWADVEAFFTAAREHMRAQDYKAFVEKSHRRFHPDRWSSRNLLRTIADETVRSTIEVAANTVAQALTPLWSDAKRGR